MATTDQCAECAQAMNPAEAMLSRVCGICTKRNHAAAIGRRGLRMVLPNEPFRTWNDRRGRA